MVELRIQIPNELATRLDIVAEQQLRSPEAQAAWFVREALLDEKTGALRLVLSYSGDNKIQVIKEVRESMRIGLKESLELVNRANAGIDQTVGVYSDATQARMAQARFDALGAVTRLEDF